MNPFSSDDLWRISRFTIEALPPLEDLPWDTNLPVADSVWKLDLFSDDIERPNSPTVSTVGSSDDTQSTSTSVLHDAIPTDEIWRFDVLNEISETLAPRKTWERYHDRLHHEHVSAYFTESGPRGFDAALSRQAKTHGKPIAGRMVNENIFIRSALRLGLGWSSPLFRFNESTSTFDTAVGDLRISGVSLSMVQSVISDVLPCGTRMQKLRRFAKSAPRQSTDLPSLYTLRGTIGVIIYNLEAQVLSLSRQVDSILQVLTLFRSCEDLINTVAHIVQVAQRAASDAELTSVIIDCASVFAQSFGRMENLLFEIVARVTSPWLEFVEHWIGLRAVDDALDGSISGGNRFVQVDNYDDSTKFKTGSKRTDYTFITANVPSFIPQDLARTVFESGRSLRLLKRSHPAHPIGRKDVISQAGSLALQIATTWDDIERIQRQAEEYESNLRHEILRYQQRPSHKRPSTSAALPHSTRTFSTALDSVYELFDVDGDKTLQGTALDKQQFVSSKLAQLTQAGKEELVDTHDMNSRFGPELSSALHLSLASIIGLQAQLIDYSYLHHLFKEHNLRQHLNVQRQFQLLGDGLFVTRLTTSLFDPEMESGERKRGVVRTGIHTGLRLGSRDGWPPASSELRLVLNGLLGECYLSDESTNASEKSHHQQDNELPGGLSFAIRDLTDEEIEKCRDPNAIEALDFLRLQYKPPTALEVLFTPKSLVRYDRLFKHLLRLLRMISVVKDMVRDSTHRGSSSGDTRNVFQRFRIDAQHFVLALSDYCFQVAIGLNWSNFQKSLDRIEHCLDRGDIDGTIEVAHSVPRLRGFHEDVLNQMLFAMFLSKRHAPAGKSLDTIFGIILAFAPLSKAEGWNGLRYENEGQVLHLYSTFRKHTSAFAAYLRSLDPAKTSLKPPGQSGKLLGSAVDTMSIFEHLRIRLDLKEYY
ncbi:hypothetical protein PDE_00368 [Penicillium oxalicum 114-2]|uniref:Spindle pole body component n=1 Tax=Penicillium oxalicum (strain 114-2 / CGMCC 5302) TaxID=933388 RepID=S7Z4J7_PENO1|nr:hypothetical protein PDE_00368 [Penicillium oxalicum 114-2]